MRLLEDAWRTAPNHSRPTSCVIDADIDAEDHAERNLSKNRAITMLNVAIEFGLCRSGRTRRAAQPEARWRQMGGVNRTWPARAEGENGLDEYKYAPDQGRNRGTSLRKRGLTEPPSGGGARTTPFVLDKYLSRR